MYKLTLTVLLLLTISVGCKKKEPNPNSYPCQTGNCNVTPPFFHYIIADNQGVSLLPPGDAGVGISYMENGQLNTVTTLVYPEATQPGTAIPFIVNGAFLAGQSEQGGIKTFYLTYRGKTDTLGLDIQRDPTNAATGGHTTPVVTFDSRPMQSVSSDPNLPIYYVLKRR